MSNLLLLQAGGLFESLGSVLPLLMIPVVMYFFMIRPQQNRQKEQDAFAASITPGTEVCTMSGIIGKIKKIDGNIITLEVDNNTFIRMTKSAISKDMTEAIRKK
jgi:preprotein translocase subunit YajC